MKLVYTYLLCSFN